MQFARYSSARPRCHHHAMHHHHSFDLHDFSLIFFFFSSSFCLFYECAADRWDKGARDFTRIPSRKVAIRITNQVLSILDEAIDASPQPRTTAISFPPSTLILVLVGNSQYVPRFTFKRSSSKSICSGASASLMILNIAPPFMADYTAALLRFSLRNIGLLV